MYIIITRLAVLPSVSFLTPCIYLFMVVTPVYFCCSIIEWRHRPRGALPRYRPAPQTRRPRQSAGAGSGRSARRSRAPAHAHVPRARAGGTLTRKRALCVHVECMCTLYQTLHVLSGFPWKIPMRLSYEMTQQTTTNWSQLDTVRVRVSIDAHGDKLFFNHNQQINSDCRKSRPATLISFVPKRQRVSLNLHADCAAPELTQLAGPIGTCWIFMTELAIDVLDHIVLRGTCFFFGQFQDD